jgi:hypothetical protein
MPIIRMEVDGMRYSIIKALTNHAVEMDGQIQSAVDKYCTPENMARVIDAAAKTEIDNAIKAAIEQFYRYGDGRKAIASAVAEALKDRP